jgi:hypothetical protein
LLRKQHPRVKAERQAGPKALTEQGKVSAARNRINSTDTHLERDWLDPNRVVLLEGTTFLSRRSVATARRRRIPLKIK